MYYAWRKHGVLPSVIYNLQEGELATIAAFMMMEGAN
jgi:hypothetical protein